MLSQLKIFDQQLRNALPEGINLEEIFVPIGKITVVESLELYKVNQREGKYGVLQKFFEQTEKYMGEAEFRRVAIGFISRYPSEDYTLTAYHPRFAGFVKANCGDKAFLGDLAKHEWAWHRVSRKEWLPQSETIREDLGKVDPLHMKFVISPTLIVEKFQYMISDIYRQMKNDEEVTFVQKDHFVMYWRPDPMTRQRKIMPLWQAHMVKLMKRGVTLDVAISNILSHTKVDPQSISLFIDELLEDKVILKVK